MNDDEFDEMLIDNHTTMHVDKTPVQSGSKSRTTDINSKISSLSSVKTNRSFERQSVDPGGDHSKSAGDVRSHRPQSPVAGTSKDDSESPVIPVVHPGTKVFIIIPFTHIPSLSNMYTPSLNLDTSIVAVKNQ